MHTLALVDEVTLRGPHRLRAVGPSLAPRGPRRSADPGAREFERSLDVFPLEYGEIVANHVTIVGHDPFAGARIAEADLRRRASCRPRVI